jgi:hypothetical protein
VASALTRSKPEPNQAVFPLPPDSTPAAFLRLCSASTILNSRTSRESAMQKPQGTFGLPARSSSRDRFNKLNWLNAQRMRQFDDVDQTDVAFTSFDSADIVSMQVRQLRQAFLGKAALRPQFANASAE